MSELQLPRGWQLVHLNDVCQINPRRPPNLIREAEAPTTFIPMASVDEVSGLVTAPEIKPYEVVKKGYTYFVEGDVLFAKITPCMENGKHAIARNLIDGLGFGTTEFHVIHPSNHILAEWIHLFVRQPTVLNAAASHFTGAVGQQRVPSEFLATLEIPLPPLDEQRRIATILTEQLEAVAQARAAAEAELAAAQELSAAYLREVFESDEAKGWPILSLGELCADISDGTHFTPTYLPQGIPFLSVKNIRETGISFDDCRYISEAQHLELCRRAKPERGDVLYTKVGTTGIAKAIDIDREFSIFVSVALLKLHTNILPAYLEKVLNSPLGKRQAADLTQGMANRNLVIQDVKKIRVPVPSLAVQSHIAAITAQNLVAIERLKLTIEQKLDAINQLPMVLLHHAFNGEL